MIKKGWVQRAALTQATKDEFEGRAFGFGKADCMMLAFSHLRRFGYDLPAWPAYRGLKAARSALAGQGADSLPELLDRYLQPIAPAFIWPGDIVAGKGRNFHSLAISTGPLLFGWCEGHAAPVNFALDAKGVVGAWRVEILQEQ